MTSFFKHISAWFRALPEKRRAFAETHPRKARVLQAAVAIWFVPFIYLVEELYNYGGVSIVRLLFNHPLSALFGLLITFHLCLIVYLAVRKGWIAGIIVGVVFHVFGLINYIKTALNGEHFMPWDFAMAGNMGELMSFTRIRLPFWMYLLPIATAAAIVLLWFFRCDLPKPKKLSWRWTAVVARYCGIALIVYGFFATLGNSRVAAKTMGHFNMLFEDAFLQNSNYVANGFVGAFTLNLASMSVDPPASYDEDSVDALLDGYQRTEGAATPDVIVVLCESFWDIRNLPDTEFEFNPLSFWDSLLKRDNAYSGTMYSTAIGGGTVRPEFDMLTGLTSDYLPSGTVPYQYVTRDIPTYVSAYKDQGYTTIAMHPYDKTFYSRDKGYGHIGFDSFYGQAEIEEMLGDVTYNRGYVSDDSFADAMIGMLEEHKDEPTMLFGITMENHQTYYALDEDKIELHVTNEHLSGDVMDAVVTYTQGIYHADQALKKLVDYIDGRDKETVLVFFGDHLPTLGANFAAYKATGLFDNVDADEAETLTMFGTPFVVYGNYKLPSGIFKKSGNQMSAYYIMSAVAVSTDTDRTPYMNLLLDTYDKVPYYNKKLRMKSTADIKNLRNMHQIITYDLLLGEQYAVK